MNTDHSDLNKTIEEMERMGLHPNSHRDNEIGLGDIVEHILNKMGITEEKFKQWFNLDECNCSKRKQWLNGLLSWKKNKTQPKENA
jgi:hypothetical protein